MKGVLASLLAFMLLLLAAPTFGGQPLILSALPSDGAYVLTIKDGKVVSFERGFIINIGDVPVIPDDPDDPVDPVDPDSLKAAVALALANVTAPDKKETAKNLAEAYRITLADASVTDFGVLGIMLGLVTETATANKEGWSFFADLMTEQLKASTSLQQTFSVLTIAATELEKVL